MLSTEFQGSDFQTAAARVEACVRVTALSGGNDGASGFVCVGEGSGGGGARVVIDGWLMARRQISAGVGDCNSILQKEKYRNTKDAETETKKERE